MVNVITKENFKSAVIDSKKTVIIDFWASWCGPCRMLSPIIDDLSQECSDINVCKVNVDEQPELAQQFGVMSIPMVVALRRGKIVGQSVGVRSKEAILSLLD